MGAMTSYLATQGFGQSYLIWVVNFHVFFTQLIFQLLIAKAISIQSASGFNSLHSRWKKLSASKGTILFVVYFSREGYDSNCFLRSKNMNVINQVVLKSVCRCSRNKLTVKLVFH